MLSIGIAPQVVMKFTGHADYKSMKPYIDIAEKANFAENYSLFVGINVYLPRIFVRIFVDFE